MLDDIAFGPFLEQPAGKDAYPLIVALVLDGQLHKGPGFGRIFPWRGGLASPQPNNGAADPRRIAGRHFQIADQPIAFVEQRNDRDTVGHRRRAFDPADFSPDIGRFDDLGRGFARIVAIAGGRAIASGDEQHRRAEREQPQRNRADSAPHSAPGRQAS